MMTKTIDICLPPAKTEYEEWRRFLNRMQTELAQIVSSRRKIVVK